MAKKIIDFIDEHGLVVHKIDGKIDGGDSPQRTGTLWTALSCLEGEHPILDGFTYGKENVEKVLKAIQIKPGVWIRHPNSCDPWHSDPKEFSRDQQTPLVIALGFYRGEFQAAWQALADTEKAHRERWWKYQNRDWATVQQINYYHRAFNRNKSYWLGDNFLSMDARLQWSKSSNPDDVGDHLNLQLALIQALRRKPTEVVKKAVKFYIKNLRPNYGCFLEEGVTDDQAKQAYTLWASGRGSLVHPPALGIWKWYLRQPSAPPLDMIMEPVLERYLL